MPHDPGARGSHRRSRAIDVSAIVAVADGSGGMFATAGADGRISVRDASGGIVSAFDAPVADESPVWSNRLAVVDVGAVHVVVGSWRRGVAAYTVDGRQVWHRRDVRQVQAVRPLPSGDGSSGWAGVVVESGPGLVLGPTGGTRHRLPGVRFLAGGPDGSVLVHDRRGLNRRPAPNQGPAWRADPGTFAVLDAVLDEVETLVCGADGRLSLFGAGGIPLWRTPDGSGRRIVRVCPDPAGPGWLCLAFPAAGGAEVLRAGRDGGLVPVGEVPLAAFGFAGGGRFVVATDGTITPVA